MRLQSFLEMERNNEMLQRKEFELATHLKLNKEKVIFIVFTKFKL